MPKIKPDVNTPTQKVFTVIKIINRSKVKTAKSIFGDKSHDYFNI